MSRSAVCPLNDRKKTITGKCGGRKNYTEIDPQMVALARHLRGGKGWRPYSLRKVAAELAAYGYTTPSGKPYSASAVQSMLGYDFLIIGIVIIRK